MRFTRIGLVSLAIVLAFAATGCSGGSAKEPAGRSVPTSEASEPASATATEYSASVTAAGAAIGAELQRTADLKLGGEAWVMSVSGKAELAGPRPAIAIFAVDAAGKRTPIWTLSPEERKDISTAQGRVDATIPKPTRALVIATTLTAPNATETAPAITVPLAEVPLVKSLNTDQD